MANIIVADGQYQTVEVNTTLVEVAGKLYYIKNTSAGQITVTYGVDNTVLQTQDLGIFMFDGSLWSDLTPSVSITELNPTFDSLTVNGNITQTAGVTSLKETTIEQSTVNGLNLYRTLNTSGSGIRLNFYGKDSAGDQAKYAFIRNEIVSNTASSVDGALEFAVAKNSVVTPYMYLTNNGALILDTNLADNTVDLLQVGSNTNISCSFGYMRASSIGGVSYLGYTTDDIETEYVIRRSASGFVSLNATSAHDVKIQVATANVATFSGSAIDLLKPTTITGGLTIDSNALLDYNATTRDLTIYNSYSGDDADIGFDMNFAGQQRIMTLKRVGRVGIGIDDPQSALHISGNITLSGGAVRGITGSANNSMYINALGNADTEGVLIQQNGVTTAEFLNTGRVTIGMTDNTVDLLQVNGSAWNTTGVWDSPSDRRVKENIRELSNPLQRVLDIAQCVRQYNYIEETGIKQNTRTQYIAQELIEKGFAGYVKEAAPLNEAVGEILGWEYADEAYTEEQPATTTEYTYNNVIQDGVIVSIKEEIEVPVTTTITEQEIQNKVITITEEIEEEITETITEEVEEELIVTEDEEGNPLEESYTETITKEVEKEVTRTVIKEVEKEVTTDELIIVEVEKQVPLMETITKTRRVVVTEGEKLLQVEQNLSPYFAPAISALNDKVVLLEEENRVMKLELDAIKKHLGI
jgi:hypothetical protein